MQVNAAASSVLECTEFQCTAVYVQCEFHWIEIQCFNLAEFAVVAQSDEGSLTWSILRTGLAFGRNPIVARIRALTHQSSFSQINAVKFLTSCSGDQ